MVLGQTIRQERAPSKSAAIRDAALRHVSLLERSRERRPGVQWMRERLLANGRRPPEQGGSRFRADDENARRHDARGMFLFVHVFKRIKRMPYVSAICKTTAPLIRKQRPTI
jgi:hypothetical protein